MFFFRKKEKFLCKRYKENKSSFFSKLKTFFSKKSKIKIDEIDNIEKILLTSDIGTETTIKLIQSLEKKIEKNKILDEHIHDVIKHEILRSFIHVKKESLKNTIDKNKKPYVFLIVGVNGVGKTTTVGKLSFLLKKMGFNPIIGASDTFREAAIDQLEIWSKMANVPLVKQRIHSDPASVAYDTLQSAISKKRDVVIIDTAGRLHNRTNLMKELFKVKRVIKKVIPEAPHEITLILDATNGQNAFEQVKQFISFIGISSIILTKTDGTAKGGFIIKITDQFKIPILYIGVGEKIEDLKEFNEVKFVDSFFEKNLRL
ncbi:signal recognition particle-docking protein FtsY [Blattabacterium cuenoti]|uniref:signal recognition particle-docking protein FtsY n=1 Tax=Blattabacterium cuenoti TaxID=1653831 RepID=UPI00163BB05F|nr:signal recognition particle-docking protein FtsY [Blattabacterium cuenoti]